MNQKADQERATAFAKSQGCTGDPWFVDDKWGGYWQAPSPHGPYTFRLSHEQDGRK